MNMFIVENSITSKAIYTNNHFGCTLNENSAISAPIIVSKPIRLVKVPHGVNGILKLALLRKIL